MNAKDKRISAKRKTYRWVLFGITISAVAWFVVRNLKDISSHSASIRPCFALLAFTAVTAGYLARFFVWTRLAAMVGLHSPVLRAGRAYFLSVLGRYMPGKTGLALVRIEAYSDRPAAVVIFATGMELMLAMAAAVSLTLIGLALSPTGFPAYLKWSSITLLVLLFVSLSPPVLERALPVLFRLTKRPPPRNVFSYGTNLSLALLYIIPGLLQGLGLFLLLNSMGHVPFGQYIVVTGVYFAARLAGLLAFFAPGGLGVREGVMFLVLPLIVPEDNAIIATVVMRMVAVVSEVGLAGTFSLLSIRQK